jgi:hypothetical protein
MLHIPRAPDRAMFSIPAASCFWVADRAAFGLRVRSKLLVLENKTVGHSQSWQTCGIGVNMKPQLIDPH